ncbi:hypothetical protein Tco_0487297 [Tanacetum coccineum]
MDSLSDFEELTPDMRQDLAERMRMVYTRMMGRRIEDEMGLDVAGTLCFQLGGARRSMTWRQFILALGFHTADEMAEDKFGAYWLGSERLIPDKGDLSDYWVEISSGKDFLRGAPSFTYIRDPILRLCHWLIAYSIAGRSQAPEKSGAYISGGQFIARLAEHFRLLTMEILQGLTVIASKLPIIDMAKLVRLQICMDIDDTWAWVAMGPERQPDAAAGAPGVAQDAPVVDEGVQAAPAPEQAP